MPVIPQRRPSRIFTFFRNSSSRLLRQGMSLREGKLLETEFMTTLICGMRTFVATGTVIVDFFAVGWSLVSFSSRESRGGGFRSGFRCCPGT